MNEYKIVNFRYRNQLSITTKDWDTMRYKYGTVLNKI